MSWDWEESSALDNIKGFLEEINSDMPTLRDRFAMATLTGLLAASPPGWRFEPEDQKRLARDAYVMAGVMLEARKESP
jgi:hypothetical protein